MTKVKAAFFDLDGTLIHFPSHSHCVGASWGAVRALRRVAGRFGVRLSNARCIQIFVRVRALMRVHAATRTTEEALGGMTVDAVWERCLAFELARLVGAAEEESCRRLARAAHDEFFAAEFPPLCRDVRPLAGMVAFVRALSASGVRVALFTNPLTPLSAIEARMASTGLAPSDFELVTHSGNWGALKPSPAYYEAGLVRMGLAASEAIMVGNDPVNDSGARGLGVATCIVDPVRDADNALIKVAGFLETAVGARF